MPYGASYFRNAYLLYLTSFTGFRTPMDESSAYKYDLDFQPRTYNSRELLDEPVGCP